MQISLLKLLSPFVFFSDAFKHDVRSLRFLEGYHLHFHSIFKFHDLRKQSFADLALKLREVVRDCYSIGLPFYFAVYPVLKAACMHKRASSLAETGTDQRVGFSFLIAQANLARFYYWFRWCFLRGFWCLTTLSSYLCGLCGLSLRLWLHRFDSLLANLQNIFIQLQMRGLLKRIRSLTIPCLNDQILNPPQFHIIPTFYLISIPT